jgi:hypothetical protein
LFSSACKEDVEQIHAPEPYTTWVHGTSALQAKMPMLSNCS